MFLSRKLLQGETLLEEIFNAGSHGIGIFLGIAALVTLVTLSALHGSSLKIVTTAIYGSTIVLMFTASTLYHASPWPRIKAMLKVLDHISIYLLIAGSYTPIMLVSIGGDWGWSILSVVWGLALFGIVFKVFFTGRFETFSLSLYALMGWLAVVAYYPLLHSLPLAAVLWLLVGGLCYTFGIIFYVLDTRYHFSHFLWHLFVLAGCVTFLLFCSTWFISKKGKLKCRKFNNGLPSISTKLKIFCFCCWCSWG